MSSEASSLITKVFIATSLDGFIARIDGSIDWLLEFQAAAPAGEDFGYSQFFASVDALVMGRKTFETVSAFPEWPYGEKPVYVLSRTLTEVAPPLKNRVVILGGDPPFLVRELEQRGHRVIYLDGGTVVQDFMRHGYVDQLILSTIPVLLGAGRPLFGPLLSDRKWKLMKSYAAECGLVQSHYQRI